MPFLIWTGLAALASAAVAQVPDDVNNMLNQPGVTRTQLGDGSFVFNIPLGNGLPFQLGGNMGQMPMPTFETSSSEIPEPLVQFNPIQVDGLGNRQLKDMIDVVCKDDKERVCGGHHHKRRCLRHHLQDLSPQCSAVVAKFEERHHGHFKQHMTDMLNRLLGRPNRDGEAGPLIFPQDEPRGMVNLDNPQERMQFIAPASSSAESANSNSMLVPAIAGCAGLVAGVAIAAVFMSRRRQQPRVQYSRVPVNAEMIVVGTVLFVCLCFAGSSSAGVGSRPLGWSCRRNRR
jgi:hypothetical protein